MDDNLRALAAVVPQINQWDDHETHNNWWPGQILDDPNYTEKRVDVLSARAHQALFEYLPIAERPGGTGHVYRKISYGPLLDVFVLDMRTYRDANGPDNATTDDQGILGTAQAEWLKRELAASKATWKIVAADMPLSLVVSDAHGIEAVSQGDSGSRSAASCRSPTCCPPSRSGAYGTSCGSPPTCTTRPRTTTTRPRPRSRTSTRSGSSSPAR
jgi:alkaline phosphatase D